MVWLGLVKGRVQRPTVTHTVMKSPCSTEVGTDRLATTITLFTCILEVCLKSQLDHRLSRGQGYSNPGRQIAVATKLFKVAPNICGSSVREFLRVTVLTPKNSRWLLNFYKICVPQPDGYLGVSEPHQ